MSAFGLTAVPIGGNGTGGSSNQQGPSQNNTNNNNNNNRRNTQRHRSQNGTNQNRQNPKQSQQQQGRQQQQGGGQQGKPRQNHKEFDGRKPSNRTRNNTDFQSADTGATALSANNGGVEDPEYIVQQKVLPSGKTYLPEPSKIHDQFIGPLFKNAESFGFNRKPFKQDQILPNYLIQEQKFLDLEEFDPDDWDIANQEKMLKLEQETADSKELMDILEPMREKERTEMENRGLVDKANVSKSLADAIVFRGSCLYMCPIFEKIKRKLNGDISKYEKVGSEVIPIKTFSRSEAGQAPQLPSDVRPPHVLVQTLDYIVENLLNKLPDSEAFIWNRTRSIRQDFTYQNYFGPEAVYCTEKICRMHILTLHIMAGSEIEYSQQQELEQLNKSLETLNEIYDDLRTRSGQAQKISTNEAEFRSYYIISYYDKPELDQMIQNLPMELLRQPILQMAIMFRGYLLQNNTSLKENLPGGLNFFVQFFNAVYDKATPFLMGCLLEVHFNQIRFYALKSMSNAYHSGGKPYFAVQLADMLGFDNVEKLSNFVDYYDLKTAMDNDQLCVYLSPFKYNLIKEKEKLKQSYTERLDLKLNGRNYQQVINISEVTGTENVDGFVKPKPIQVQNVQTGMGSAPIRPAQHIQAQVQPKQQPMQFTSTPSTQIQPNPPSMIFNKPPEVISKQPIPPVSAAPSIFTKPQIATTAQPPPVAPPASAPAPKPKITDSPLFTKAANEIYSEILANLTRSQLQETVVESVRKEQARRGRHVLVAQLRDELFEAFMNEMIQFTVIESMAEQFRRRNLQRKLIRRVKPIAESCLQNVKLKASKIAEFDEFTNRSFHEKSSNGNSSNRVVSNGMMKEMMKKKNAKLRSISQHRQQQLQRPQNKNEEIDYKKLWEPINLLACFVSKLKKPESSSTSTSVNFVVIVKDWNELSARWLISKLGLHSNQSKTSLVNRVIDPAQKLKLKFMGLPTKFQESDFFKKAGFLLFEMGRPDTDDNSKKIKMNIETKLKTDAKVLAKILEMAKEHFVYDKIRIAILYYNSTTDKISIDRVRALLNLKSLTKQYPFLDEILLFDMNTPDIANVLETCMNELSTGYELKYKPIDIEVPSSIDQTSDISNMGLDEATRNKKKRKIEFLKATMMAPRRAISLRTSNNSSSSSIASTLNSVSDLSRITSHDGAGGGQKIVQSGGIATPLISYSRFNNADLYDNHNNQTTMMMNDTGFVDPNHTFVRANNRTVSNISSVQMMTSTPYGGFTGGKRSISGPGSDFQRQQEVVRKSSNGNGKLEKISELRRLTAGILDKKRNG